MLPGRPAIFSRVSCRMKHAVDQHPQAPIEFRLPERLPEHRRITIGLAEISIPSRRRMGCVWHAAARLPGILFRHVLVTEASERDGPAIVPGDSVSPERCGGYQPEAATQTNALGSSVNSS